MESLTETGVYLPPGVEPFRPPTTGPVERGVVVNETELPDNVVRGAVETFFEENASVLGVNAGSTTFQSYSNGNGSLLARGRYQTPANVIDEIILARSMAERDDDVASTIGSMMAMAFSEGMRHVHTDEVTVALFDQIAQHMNLDHVLNELYRELLVASQVNSVHLFTRESLQFQPQGADRQRSRTVVAPLVGVLPAEQVRVLDNDMFSTGTLAYKPGTAAQQRWLEEFFSESTTAARKAEMRRQDPVLTTLLVEELVVKHEEPSMHYADTLDTTLGSRLYRLNPRMIARSSFAKGAWKYPRPLLTRNFAMLEAKRLLNLMDYALLQGGANFLVVAKKGSDQRPAMPEEVRNLRDQVARASRTGVIIGDHRLNIDIITPDLGELLNPAKRNLLGRKISSALLRLPDYSDPEAGGGQSVIADTEIVSRVISNDRRLIRRHLENNVYGDIAKRNGASFQTGPASIWFPKIVLQGLQYFTDMVLKLRDRGDISRHSAVSVAGFDYDSEVASRKREKADDRVMTPAEVPFSSPGQPADNGGGRPPGGSAANGAPGSAPSRSTRDPGGRPSRVIQRNAGETVRAMYEEGVGSYRVGALTYGLLEEYADAERGRMTTHEREALDRIAREPWPEGPIVVGPVSVMPVNPEYDIENIKPVRLANGLTMLVGDRVGDDALVARAIVVREPEFDTLAAEEIALRWGFMEPAALSYEEPAPVET